MSEKKPRKPRTNHKSQIEDVILYCKVNIEILEGQVAGTVGDLVNPAKIDAFKSVLRRLGQEVQ